MPTLSGTTKLASWPEDWFNIKMLSYLYRYSHCGNKTIQFYLHNFNSYTGNTSYCGIEGLNLSNVYLFNWKIWPRYTINGQDCVVHTIHPWHTVYPKKYTHGFCFAMLCCGNTLTDFPISIGLISLALWQSNDCPSASKATLMNMDECFMWIHYERLRNHNKARHNKTVCIFLGIYVRWPCIPQYCMQDDSHTERMLATSGNRWHIIHLVPKTRFV